MHTALDAGASRSAGAAQAPAVLAALSSPVLFRGDATTAYRDPAALHHEGAFHLFFTLVRRAACGTPYSCTAWSRSLDRRHDPVFGQALMFFHGSDYPEDDPRGGFDPCASIGPAWRADLDHWQWSGKVTAG